MLKTVEVLCVFCVYCTFQANFINGQVPESPCPDVFRYKSDRYGWFGQIFVQNPPIGELRIELESFLPAFVTNNYYGAIELIGSSQDTFRKIENGQTISFRVEFPLQQPLPKPTTIRINNQVICYGEQPNLNIRGTKMFLDFTLQTYGYSRQRPQVYGSYPSEKTEQHYYPPQNPTVDSTYNTNLPSEITKPMKIIPQITYSGISLAQPKYRKMEECGRPILSATKLVIGGIKTNRGTWPWLVALYSQIKGDLSYTCGGTLISKTAVITAAHCLYSDTLSRKLLITEVILAVGRYNLLQWLEPNTQLNMVVQLIKHEAYNFDSQIVNDADIALVIMAQEVTYTQFVQPICLWSPAKDQQDVAGRTGVVVGWGRDEVSEKADTPRMVTVNIISETDCLRDNFAYKYLTSNRTFCAGDKSGRGPCTGDSGSGFVMKRNDQYVLRGIVSTSLADRIAGCDVYKYAVYTDVSKYFDWIDENLQKN